MNKCMLLSSLFFFCLASISCFAQIKGKQTREAITTKDSIEYYEVEIGIKQKDYMEVLAGSWTIDTMRRQAKADPEVLSNASLDFLSDSTFRAGLRCIQLEGSYRLKGTSIKFYSLHSSTGTCESFDQEAALERLLIQTVSAYTVDGDVLLLRDGSSNVVFKAHRKKG